MASPLGGRLTTWFSGKSAPEDRDGPGLALYVLAAFALFSPMGLMVALGCFIAFSYFRISHKTIAVTAAAYTIPFALTVLIGSSIGGHLHYYLAPWRALVAALKARNLDGFLGDTWWLWFSHQIWASLAMGLTLGALWTSWKWLRRPVWEDQDKAPTFFQRRRRDRIIDDIAADIDGPRDGNTLGVDIYGNRVVQLSTEAAAHTLLAGGSGSGKTTTMMTGIRDAIRRGEAVCVIDLKGSQDLPAQLEAWSARYGRRFLHWSITPFREGYHGPADGPAFYDPIGRGDPSRKKDLIIGAEKWDVEYYKSVNEIYLQTAFQIAELVPNHDEDALSDLASLLDIGRLKRRAAQAFLNAEKTPEGVQHAHATNEACRWWEYYPTLTDSYVRDTLDTAATLLINPTEQELSAVKNMSARIQKLRQSTAGHWLRRDPNRGRDIDLRRAAEEGWVVVFSLDSANYPATSQQVGALIVQDLNTLSSELRHRPVDRIFRIYVDEFSAIGNDNILGLLARARDAKMPTMLSTQALADLKRADPAFLEQALGIVSSFIIHRANTAPDAEALAGLTGKHWVYRKRYGIEMTSGLPGGIGTGAATGQGHVEQEEDYVVPASAFQKLKKGECVYIAKSPESRVVYPIAVVMEDPEKYAEAHARGETSIAASNTPALASDRAPKTFGQAEVEGAFPTGPDAEDHIDADAFFAPPSLPDEPETPDTPTVRPAAGAEVDLSEFETRPVEAPPTPRSRRQARIEGFDDPEPAPAQDAPDPPPTASHSTELHAQTSLSANHTAGDSEPAVEPPQPVVPKRSGLALDFISDIDDLAPSSQATTQPHEPVRREPTQPGPPARPAPAPSAPAPSASVRIPTPPTGFAFGGANVDWEAVAPDLDSAEKSRQ